MHTSRHEFHSRVDWIECSFVLGNPKVPLITMPNTMTGVGCHFCFNSNQLQRRKVVTPSYFMELEAHVQMSMKVFQLPELLEKTDGALSGINSLGIDNRLHLSLHGSSFHCLDSLQGQSWFCFPVWNDHGQVVPSCVAKKEYNEQQLQVSSPL